MTISRSNLSADPPRVEPAEAIAVAARGLFEVYGYAKTTVGDIARAAAMSPANMYRYYRNKQAIGLAVVEAYLREEHAAIERALAACGDGAEARLRAHVGASVGFLVAHLREAPKLVELAEMLHATADGRALIEARVAATLEDYARLIADGVASGAFALPPRMAEPGVAAEAAMLALRYFHAPIALSRHGVESVEADLATTLDLICAALGAPQSSADAPSWVSFTPITATKPRMSR